MSVPGKAVGPGGGRETESHDFPFPWGQTEQDVRLISQCPRFSLWHAGFPVSIPAIS